MIRPKYVFLVREEFVEARYRSFIEKKDLLHTVDPTGRFFTITDLDAACGFGDNPARLLSDIVLCDVCHEDIREARFVMLERSRCYHIDCAKDQCWFNPREIEMLVDAKANMGNVVPIDRRPKHTH